MAQGGDGEFKKKKKKIPGATFVSFSGLQTLFFDFIGRKNGSIFRFCPKGVLSIPFTLEMKIIEVLDSAGSKKNCKTFTCRNCQFRTYLL